MRSLQSKYTLAAMIVIIVGAASVATVAQTAKPSSVQSAKIAYMGIGRTPTDEELQAAGRSAVGPSGKGLPTGKGSPTEGVDIYARKCAFCHGKNLEGVPRVSGSGFIVGGPALTADRSRPLWGQGLDRNAPVTVGNYRAFASTVFDVIYRAMPQYQGGSLTADETYSLTAFLLYKNDIIKKDAVMSSETLPQVQMPNRHGFVPDKLEDISDIKKRGCYKTYGICP